LPARASLTASRHFLPPTRVVCRQVRGSLMSNWCKARILNSDHVLKQSRLASLYSEHRSLSRSTAVVMWKAFGQVVAKGEGIQRVWYKICKVCDWSGLSLTRKSSFTSHKLNWGKLTLISVSILVFNQNGNYNINIRFQFQIQAGVLHN